MSAFLILLGSTDGHRDAAFRAGVERLSSRRPGPVRSGAHGVARWAAIADDSELARDGDRLRIADATPFMVEPASNDVRGTEVTLDLRSGSASLHRDRFGVKPLFYLRVDDGWAIASEAKTLIPFLSTVELNRIALSDAANFRWVLGEDFIIEGIRQVLPGALVTVGLTGACTRGSPHVPVFEQDSSSRSIDWWRSQTDDALRSALRRAAAKGDELAVLVSGGIDSSVLAGVATSEGVRVRGYIVRYEAHANPEYERARKVAEWLGMDVEEVVVPEADIRDRVGHMVFRLEQPPRHANNVALERLFTAIRKRNGVVIHGDGAEMMFGLGDQHRLQNHVMKRRLMAFWLGKAPWPRTVRWLQAHPGPRADRALRVAETTPADFARRFDAIRYSSEARAILDPLMMSGNPCPELSSLLPDDVPSHEDLQLYQTLSFLQCSLVRLDRIASPLGVPVAIPFLSSEAVEVARRLPRKCKERAGTGRPILRDLCNKYLPAEVERWPKMGFQSPDREWILRERDSWRERLVHRAPDAITPFLSADAIDRLFRLDDHEAQWFVMTLYLTLMQLAGPDRDSAP